jgi:signal recognition particle subunit SRP54
MFKSLSDGFRKARQKLTGVGELTEDVIDGALREVRLSLLEADVELNVTRRFLAKVREKMLGQRVQLKAEAGGRKATVTPEQLFIKACQDELVAMMTSGKEDEIEWAPKGTPTLIMMVGLQGQGKTTSSAKLARLLTKQGKKVLLVAADLQRPAAVEQLQVLGKKVDVPVFAVAGSTPVEVCKRALAVARVQKKDVVIFDTAGRLAIDTPLMEELRAIKSESKPHNILLVVNAAIGQNALATAQAFHDTLGLTGVAHHHARRRRPRRRGALHPRGHGRAHSLRRHRRADGPPRAVSPRRHGVAHPRDGRHRGAGEGLHRGRRSEAGRAGRDAHAPGPVWLQRLRAAD